MYDGIRAPPRGKEKNREDAENHHRGQFASKPAKHHRRIESSSLAGSVAFLDLLHLKVDFISGTSGARWQSIRQFGPPSTSPGFCSINTTNSKKRYSRFLINDVVISSLDLVTGTLRPKSRP